MRIFAYIAGRLDTEFVAEILRRLRPEQTLNLGLRPDVERALAFFQRLGRIDHAVGVLCGVEAAFRIEHVAQDVVENAASRIGQRGVAGDLEGLEVGGG